MDVGFVLCSLFMKIRRSSDILSPLTIDQTYQRLVLSSPIIIRQEKKKQVIIVHDQISSCLEQHQIIMGLLILTFQTHKKWDLYKELVQEFGNNAQHLHAQNLLVLAFQIPYAGHYKPRLVYFCPIFHCGLYCRAVYITDIYILLPL